MERHEFVVVGAGLLGLSAGAALARRGHDVVVLEQSFAGHPAAGSKGSCRIFRLGYADPAYVWLARRARQSWAELEGAAGRQLLLPVPHLTVGSGLSTVREAMLAAGAPCELLGEDEAAARFPAVRLTGQALLEAASCVIDASAALRALASLVPDLREYARVSSLADDGNRVLVRAAGGLELSCRAAVVCAGPWAARLLAPCGVSVPTLASLEQVGYLTPASGSAELPIIIEHGGRGFYGLPVPGSRQYKVGLHHDGPDTDPDRQDQRTDPALDRRLAEAAAQFLPGLTGGSGAAERCIYDNTPDEDFIVDRAGNIVVGGGTSGHGFKFGPLLGEWLAELATAGRPPSYVAQACAALVPRFALGAARSARVG
jgi:sarcosine oxidase